MNTGINKVTKLVAGIFLGIGLIYLIISGGMLYSHFAVTNDYVKIEGRVIDIYHGKPLIEYEMNGYQGLFQSNTSRSDIRPGSRVNILVDPENPENAADGTIRIIGFVFTAMGAIMLLVGSIILATAVSRQKKNEMLYVYGQRVTTVVDAVKMNTSININRRHPVQIYAWCDHPITGAHVYLHSQNLMHTNLQEGDRVDILFDQMNEKLYCFDVKESA